MAVRKSTQNTRRDLPLLRHFPAGTKVYLSSKPHHFATALLKTCALVRPPFWKKYTWPSSEDPPTCYECVACTRTVSKTQAEVFQHISNGCDVPRRYWTYCIFGEARRLWQIRGKDFNGTGRVRWRKRDYALYWHGKILNTWFKYICT